MATNIAEFNRWLEQPREDENLEFKEAKSGFDLIKLYRYCIALANEGGGKLVFGVSDKRPRRVVDSKAFPDIVDIKSKIFTNVKFRVDVDVDVEEFFHPDGRVIIFHIPPRPRGTAYHLEGAYLMRSGEQLVPMSEDRLRAIFDEGKPDWLLEISKFSVSAEDVVRLLDTQPYYELQELPYPSNRKAVLDKFVNEKIIAKQGDLYSITNLGALLFAKRLDDFDGLSRRAPRVVVYEGKGKQKTRLDRPGNRGYAVGFTGLIDFINDQTQPNELIGRALRKPVKMFPEIAIRELVANALIHQNFQEPGMSVMIEIYSDRMEIANIGLPAIPPDRFIDEYQSRNDTLADIMRRLRICEEKGSGIDKVVTSAEEYQLPAPDFRVGHKHTTAVLFSHKEFNDMDKKDRIRACYQHCCLRWVENDRMTNQSLRKRFNLADSQTEVASRIIQETLREDRIKLEDPESTSKRYAKYIPYWA